MDKGTLGGPPDGPPADGPGNLRRRFEQAAEGLPDRPGYEIVWTAPEGDQEIIVSMEETIRLLEECKAFVDEHGPTEGESTAETLRREGERRRAIAEDARHRAADLSGFLGRVDNG